MTVPSNSALNFKPPPRDWTVALFGGRRDPWRRVHVRGRRRGADAFAGVLVNGIRYCARSVRRRRAVEGDSKAIEQARAPDCHTRHTSTRARAPSRRPRFAVDAELVRRCGRAARICVPAAKALSCRARPCAARCARRGRAPPAERVLPIQHQALGREGGVPGAPARTRRSCACARDRGGRKRRGRRRPRVARARPAFWGVRPRRARARVLLVGLVARAERARARVGVHVAGARKRAPRAARLARRLDRRGDS